MGKAILAFLLPTTCGYTKYFSDEEIDSLEFIESEFGLKGFAVVIKLWQKILGGSEGYYINWNDKVCSLFAKKLNVSKGLVFEIVNLAIKEEIFSSALYNDYGILTSAFIQNAYRVYAKRRGDSEIEKSYLLIPDTQNQSNASKKDKNVNKNSKNVNKSKPIRQDNIRLDNTISDLTNSNITALKNLTQEQYSDLVKTSSRQSVDKYIDKIIDWQRTNHKTVKNPFGLISKWIQEDIKKNSKTNSNKDTSYDLDEWEKYAMSLGTDSGDNND